MSQRLITLISGGLDSCVSTAWAVERVGPSNVVPMSVVYGQRHETRETRAAERILLALGVQEPIRRIDLRQPFRVIGGSSLTSGQSGNPSVEPVTRTPDTLPPTFVPGRNAVMLTVAAGLAYTLQCDGIVGGWNAVDYSGYPDCRPSFFDTLQPALREALSYTLSIHAPLVNLTKAAIIALGLSLNAPLQYSWSCYAGDLEPCGVCDSCVIRANGFRDLGITDPARGL